MAKTVSWILGLVFLALGILGLVSNVVLGIFDVSTAQNVVHLLSGIIAILAAASGASYARLYLIVAGIIYGIITVLGFVKAGDVLGLFTTNQAENYLYAVIALVSLAVGFGGRRK